MIEGFGQRHVMTRKEILEERKEDKAFAQWLEKHQGTWDKLESLINKRVDSLPQVGGESFESKKFDYIRYKIFRCGYSHRGSDIKCSETCLEREICKSLGQYSGGEVEA